MSEITIKSTTKEITGWTKEIKFEREGETYIATLYWSEVDGYDLVFKNPSLFKPSWAITEYDWASTLEEVLDELTDGKHKTCENCPSGDPAIYEVMTLKGELALCESCHND